MLTMLFAAAEENIIAQFVNLGGMGVLAAAMFYLHTQSLKAFREELAAERKQCHDDHEKLGSQLLALGELVHRLSDELQRRGS